MRAREEFEVRKNRYEAGAVIASNDLESSLQESDGACIWVCL